MKRSYKVIISVIAIVAIVVVSLSGCLLMKNIELERDLDMYQKITLIQSYVDKYSIYDFNEKVAEDAALKYYLAGIEDDHYSYYFSKEEMEEFEVSTAGNFVGIGVNVVRISDVLEKGLYVYRVVGNSPAEHAGIKAGDIILSANDDVFDGMTYDDAVDCMLDKEGTTVTLKAERDGETLIFDIVRSAFTQRLVDYEVIDGFGFVRIHGFSHAAASQFGDAINDLLSKGVKGFVFDVRNNPGGELTTVTSMLDLLTPKGEPIIIIQYKDSEEVINSTLKPVTDLPMTVLVNGSSASASELFSSCLRDLVGAKLVGEKTYGKGIGQTTFDLGDGTGLKITTFKYFTKSRTDYNNTGLEPDYVVETTEEQVLDFYKIPRERDLQLQKALSVIAELAAE